MKSPKNVKSALYSIQASILIGSIIISLTILVTGGVIRLKGLAAGNQVIASPMAKASTAPSPSDSGDDNGKTVSVGAPEDHVLGNKDAKITIVEFADLRCPFCERFFVNTKPQIMKEYVDTGKVKFIFRHFAFLGSASTLAANALECAGEQGKFWEAHDYFYKNQPDESDTSMYTTDKLTSAMAQLGVANNQFRSCLEGNKYSQRINNDKSDATSVGISGTPTFVIGKSSTNGTITGVELIGAQAFSAFKTVIDQQLAQ